MLRFLPHREYDTIEGLFDEADAWVARHGEALLEAAPEVSGWSPAQHLYHETLANAFAFRNLTRIVRGQADPGGATNATGHLVLRLGRIPRGRAKAPSAARPPDDLDLERLEKALSHGRRTLEGLAPHLPSAPTVPGRAPHPYLGALSAVEWLRFAHVHTAHHHRIVREILKHQRRA